MTTHRDLIVIGGGLAGLAAGATAASHGATALVLEGRRPGGRARVTGRQGFVFNLGGHALYLGGPGEGVLRSLGIRPAGRKPPLGRYRLLAGGEMHLLPTSAGTLCAFPFRPTARERTNSVGSSAPFLGSIPMPWREPR